MHDNGVSDVKWPAHARDLLLAFSVCIVLVALYFDFQSGGNDFKQGDWLVNSELLTVRRGMTGSAILHLSDMLGVSPLLPVVLLQAILVTTLYAITRYLLAGLPSYQSLVIVVAPALFVVFWPADPQGSLRKELIAFVAIALELLALKRQSSMLLGVSAALLVIAMFANELNALFAMLFLSLAYCDGYSASSFWLHIRSKPLMIHVTSASVVALGFGSLLVALKYWEVSDPSLVCRPLIERGLKEEICDGAIRWLGPGFHERSKEFFDIYFEPGNLLGHCALYVLAMLPLFYLLSRARVPKSLAALSAAAILPFLLLYPLIVDWGRLMSIQAFVIFSALVSNSFGGNYWKDRKVDGFLLAIYSLSMFVWTPAHTNGLIQGGIGNGINEIVSGGSD